jgi:hypothetical protein
MNPKDFTRSQSTGTDLLVEKPKVIERLSVSQLETFDPNSTWGCPSKWWFKHVAKISEPPNAAAETGSAMHRRIEIYLRANQRRWGSGVIHRAAAGDWLEALELSGKGFIDEVRGRAIGIEYHFDGQLRGAGIPFAGYIDVLLPDEVLDWKSTSDIGRYAKTERQVAESIQMTGYSKWYFNRFPARDTVRNTQVFFQTSGKRYAKKVSCQVTRDHTVNRWTAVESTVRLLSATALEVNSDKVEKDTTKCRMGRGGCPYFSICNPYKKDTFDMSLLDLFSDPAPAAQTPPTTPPAPVQNPTVAVTEAAQTAPVTLPPPAPIQASPQQPEPQAQAAQPSTPAQVPESSKKRGRPVKENVSSPDGESTVRPTTITVRHGLKINLGNYQSADLSVEVGAEIVKGSVEAAHETLSLEVQKALKAEVDRIQATQAKAAR